MADTLKTILVTGGAGFIGSHLCERLVQEGYRVISLDNYFAGSRDNHVSGVVYREGHTKDISEHVPEKVDIIFHLGEYSRVEQSLLEPDIVHDLNIVGTRGVIDFWRSRRCKLVYAGSSTKFGDEGRARDTTPYAASKASNSDMVKGVGDKEGLPYAVAYFYNVYGPRERAGIYGTVIESFKQMYAHGVPLAVTSPGTQQRNFTHVADIVDGLMLVGEKGSGDEYGLGNTQSFTILEVAQLFGSPIIMLPERSGNRMQSTLDTEKARALGWSARRNLTDYIRAFIKEKPVGATREKRILVFSTTFYPVSGPAEKTLLELIRKIPDVRFDVVTTAFSHAARSAPSPLPNVTVYRVGIGYWSDKYLLPFLGYLKARSLHKEHGYLFTWSLMASYAAFAGVFLKRATRLPLLITLADQNLEDLPYLVRFMLKIIFTDADQVYGMAAQEEHVGRIAGHPHRNSIGEGDAFANQLRYAYAAILQSIDK